MAMVTGAWYSISFLPFSNAAWTSISNINFPALPPAWGYAICNGTPIKVYCVDDSGPVTIATYGAATLTVDESVLTIIATLLSDTTINVAGSGDTWVSIRDGVAWYWWSDVAGTIFTLADSTTLGAFIS